MEIGWLIGFVATFFGVVIGGVLARLISGFRRSLGTIYAICAGLILGLISFDIAPEAMENRNWLVLFFGFVFGIILFKAIHLLFYLSPQLSKKTGIRTGLFLTVILSIHNLPMGVLLGTDHHSAIGSSLLQTLLLHNIPEGMILFTPLFLSGMKGQLLIVLSFLVALPVAVGALIGELLDLQGHSLWVFLLSMTIGCVYMVTVKEILPEAVKYSSNRYALLITILSFCLLGAFILYL